MGHLSYNGKVKISESFIKEVKFLPRPTPEGFCHVISLLNIE